jgi:hypothetical protein
MKSTNIIDIVKKEPALFRPLPRISPSTAPKTALTID